MPSLLLTFFAAILATPLAAEDWPQFRGPGGQGHSTETDLPIRWSEDSNIAWKVAIPGSGWSSPSIAGNRIWLTTATEDGKSLRLLSLDKATGEITLDREVFHIEDPGQIHAKNNQASPTPIVSGDRVFVHYGTYGTAALTTSGEILWKRRFPFNHVHGPGNSPILAAGLLFLNCDGSDRQYVTALDPETGDTRWRKDRPPAGMAFATPLSFKHGGREIIVSPGAKRTIAYDAATGEELWSVSYGDGFSNVPRPVLGDGIVYLCTGFYQPEILAVKLGGEGDVTETHIAWRLGGAPLTPSPILVEGILYFVNDRGVAAAVDALTGAVHWRQRLGGNHSASPVYAGGRIYFLSEEGETIVITPGKEYTEPVRNTLEGRFLASIGVSGKALFLRSDTHLYRVEKRETEK